MLYSLVALAERLSDTKRIWPLMLRAEYDLLLFSAAKTKPHTLIADALATYKNISFHTQARTAT